MFESPHFTISRKIFQSSGNVRTQLKFLPTSS